MPISVSSSQVFTFGDRLARAIAENHPTQKDFARKAGMLESAVSHCIAGRRYPSFAVLSRMVAALPSTDARWLITGQVPS